MVWCSNKLKSEYVLQRRSALWCTSSVGGGHRSSSRVLGNEHQTLGRSRIGAMASRLAGMDGLASVGGPGEGCLAA